MSFSFKMREMSWFKRRTPTEDQPKVSEFHVSGFVKIDNASCKVSIVLSNGTRIDLDAKCHFNKVYGSSLPGKWTIQAMNAAGISVLLDVEEDSAPTNDT